mmetsp:Transcript_117512/g.163593  ORF Transcript_117512/g.163593 Transcript_117512/m.163593 type:complete len:216 (+) Transcript_117512:257-904(+)
MLVPWPATQETSRALLTAGRASSPKGQAYTWVAPRRTRLVPSQSAKGCCSRPCKLDAKRCKQPNVHCHAIVTCRILAVPSLAQQGLLPHAAHETTAAHGSNAHKHKGSSSQERRDQTVCELPLKHLWLLGMLLGATLTLSCERAAAHAPGDRALCAACGAAECLAHGRCSAWSARACVSGLACSCTRRHLWLLRRLRVLADAVCGQNIAALRRGR